MFRKLSLALTLVLVLALLAACAPAAPTANTSVKPTQQPQATQRPPKPTPPDRPTRPPLPTKTVPAAQPTATDKPVVAQPTATQGQTSNLALGRKFEGIFARTVVCNNGRVWVLGGAGLTLLNPTNMSVTDFPVENLVGGPWSVGDWIWTYEYLSDDTHNGGFLVGRDPQSGQIEKYLDMMQNLEWETFLLGMGQVGSEYWIGLDIPQAMLIDKLSGKSVGAAELPGVAYKIVEDGANIWFAGEELFVMKKSTQEFTTALPELVTGLDFDGYNMWVMTFFGTLYRVDLATNEWEEFVLSGDAWAGCYDGTSYWYADAYLETIQEVILP